MNPLKFEGMAELRKTDRKAHNHVVDFLEDVERQVKRAGGKCKFYRKRSVKFVDDNSQVNGYWDDDAKELVAAIKQPFDQWLPLVVHEFGHFRQWIEEREAYTIPYFDNGRSKYTAEERFFNWLEGEYRYRDRNKLYIDAGLQRDVELDCERVALRLIREYHLPIDPKRYSKKAAAYTHFYNVIVETKTWYTPGNEPYNNERILNAMPSNLDADFNAISDELFNLFVEECYDECPILA